MSAIVEKARFDRQLAFKATNPRGPHGRLRNLRRSRVRELTARLWAEWHVVGNGTQDSPMVDLLVVYLVKIRKHLQYEAFSPDGMWDEVRDEIGQRLELDIRRALENRVDPYNRRDHGTHKPPIEEMAPAIFMAKETLSPREGFMARVVEILFEGVQYSGFPETLFVERGEFEFSWGH